MDRSNAILQQEQQPSLNPKDWIAVDPQNAWDLLHEERSLMTRITTSCADLDDILGGGISCKQVTEIGGVPGIGKTQLGYAVSSFCSEFFFHLHMLTAPLLEKHSLYLNSQDSTCCNVQMPSYCGGLGGKAIYIDTEGSFMGERAQEIAEAYVEDISEYNRFLHKDLQACQGEIQGKDVLQNIYFFRICSYTEQIALINYLVEFVSDHKDVKVVIIDSVAFHFRQGFEDLALRTRILGEMALKLVKLAKMCNLAVVVLNQVTTRYMEGSFQLTFSLGDSWSRCCTNRIILYWNGNERYAYIDKSPYLRSAAAPYSVTSRGIRNSASHCKRSKLV